MDTELQQSEKTLHERMLKEAEKVHLEFLQTMYHYYNLKEPPKPIPIKLSEKYRRGSGRFLNNRKLDSKILIGNNGQREISDAEEVRIARFLGAHETAHYLHYEFLNRTFRNSPIYSKRDTLNKIAKELVAEFGTHLFYKKVEEETPKSMMDTLCQILYPFIDRNRACHRSLIYHEVDNNVENLLEGIILGKISEQKNLLGILKELEKRQWGKEMTKDLIKYGFYI